MKSIPTHSPSNVAAIDDLGPGHAHHEFAILCPGDKAPRRVQFQRGPRFEPGSVTGVMDDDLLAIVATRLEDFQAGPYACQENALALTAIHRARRHLADRVADRLRRGVLGKNVQ